MATTERFDAIDVDEAKGDGGEETKKKEEKVEDLGGNMRLIKEYSTGLGCLLTVGFISASLNGCVMVGFAVGFQQVLDVLAEAYADPDKDLADGAVEAVMWFLGIGVGSFFLTIGQVGCWGVYG